MLSKRVISVCVLLATACVGCSEDVGNDPGSLGVERETYEGGTRLTVNGMAYTAVPGCTNGISYGVRTRGQKDVPVSGSEILPAPGEEPVAVVHLRLQNIDGSGTPTIHRDIPTFEAYRERLLYLSGRIQKDLVIRAGKRVIPASLTVFEETGGVTPYLDVLAAFDVEMSELETYGKEVTLLFADGAFNNGLLRFELDPKSFNCTTQ